VHFHMVIKTTKVLHSVLSNAYIRFVCLAHAVPWHVQSPAAAETTLKHSSVFFDSVESPAAAAKSGRHNAFFQKHRTDSGCAPGRRFADPDSCSPRADFRHEDRVICSSFTLPASSRSAAASRLPPSDAVAFCNNNKNNNTPLYVCRMYKHCQFVRAVSFASINADPGISPRLR
jgi:hypothetical protein